MEHIQTTVDALQKRFQALTPAPRISRSIQALVAEGNVNPDEIIALIRLEPLLAARLIRAANQLPARGADGVGSIEDAATALGFRRMYEILECEARRLGDPAPSYRSNRWKRAVTCAVCMESLADKHRLDRHLAYSVGLLHSLAEAIEETSGRRDEAEQNAAPFGYLNHRARRIRAGGLNHALFRAWRFPACFTEAVRFQFAPLESKSNGKAACLLNLAKWITGVIREVDELPDQALGPDVLVLNLLGEGEQTLWNLVTEVSDGLNRADAILSGGGARVENRTELSEGAI